ncbi:MAG: Omp28-related outer membrane protein [Ignavibacteria bacterium]|nr:Omp28-related outer membrane protein [Ignavibacteria bacterium]
MKLLTSYLLIAFALIFFSAKGFTQAKKVLFEEFTNASCAPCAANNPALKSFIESKGDTIIAVMYHTNFPGFDPMHNANPSQVEERRTGYYSDVNAVPWLKGDGDMFPDIWPFTLTNFNTAFDTRKSVTPLLTISVSDQRIPGDSVKSTVTVNIPQSLPPGNYKLRVMAVENVIEYANPPGTNGERIFENVFRKGFPDMSGTPVQTAAGSYEFTFKYKIESFWQDSSIHTVAFVQNDAAGKEVLNCASGRNTVTSVQNVFSIAPQSFELSQNYPNPFNPSTRITFSVPVRGEYELSVFDVIGRKVSQLVNARLEAGTYSADFSGEGLSSGVYFYKLLSKDISITKKMLLSK